MMSGIFVTKEELDRVKTACDVSGMCISGGQPMMDTPERIVFELTKKYNPPEGTGLNLETGEFQ